MARRQILRTPQNKDAFGIRLMIAVSTIATVLVVSRLYARFFYHKKVTLQDYVAIAALSSFGTFVYFTWKVVDSPGLSVHQWNVQFKNMPGTLYDISSGSTVYGIVIMLLKVGILLHWAEIFVPTGLRNTFWWTCHITIWVNVLFYAICTFIELLGCNPRPKLWDVTLKGKCLDMPRVIIASAFINFFSDIVILLLPQRVIWGLNLSTRRKIGTAALFAVGLFATTCAGFRIQSTFECARTEDVTYTIAKLGLWCLAEMTAGFFVLCLPSMPKLFRNSPWIKKIVATFKSVSKSTSKAIGTSEGRRSARTWPRARPRRESDASLFTDTSNTGFVPLTNVSRLSESETDTKQSLAGADIAKVTTVDSEA